LFDEAERGRRKTNKENLKEAPIFSYVMMDNLRSSRNIMRCYVSVAAATAIPPPPPPVLLLLFLFLWLDSPLGA
jgi:hypothetical protein